MRFPKSYIFLSFVYILAGLWVWGFHDTKLNRNDTHTESRSKSRMVYLPSWFKALLFRYDPISASSPFPVIQGSSPEGLSIKTAAGTQGFLMITQILSATHTTCGSPSLLNPKHSCPMILRRASLGAEVHIRLGGGASRLPDTPSISSSPHSSLPSATMSLIIQQNCVCVCACVRVRVCVCHCRCRTH